MIDSNCKIGTLIDIVLQILLFSAPALNFIGALGDSVIFIIYYPISVLIFMLYKFKCKYNVSLSKRRVVSEILGFIFFLLLIYLLLVNSPYLIYIAVCLAIYGILHIILFKGFSKWWWLGNAILNLMLLISLIWALQNAQTD